MGEEKGMGKGKRERRDRETKRKAEKDTQRENGRKRETGKELPASSEEKRKERMRVGRVCLLKGPFAPVYRARGLLAVPPKREGQGVPGC